MLKLSSYHNHCTYDDGRDSALDMLAAAERAGFVALGFSSHSPLPWPAPWVLPYERLFAYVEEIRLLQQQSSQVEVYLGLELDYFGEVYHVHNWHPSPPKLDFVVGSVHGFILDNQFVSVDGQPDELRQLARHFGGIRELVCAYFQQIAAMVTCGGIDFVAHFDLIKKNFGPILAPGLNFEGEDWYRAALLQALEVVARCGARLEVSTALISRSGRDELYPSKWVLPYLQRLGIPVVINSDAHATKHLGVYHQQAAELLQQAGYTSTDMLLGGRWQAIALGG